jgi:peptidoglycan hydrolase-like protein with peptidoglycan-binding domain
LPPIVLIWLALLATPQAILTTGSHGAPVQALQVELQMIHDYSGALDGQYGPETAAAVTLFEQQGGLAQDGVAGPAVLGRIVASVAKTAPLLQDGAQGAVVKDLQGLLQADGISLSIDGQFGPATDAAVKVLQTRRGLTADGVVGPETWQALFARPYTVQSGDTLSILAGRYGLPIQSLVAADGGKTSLQVGQQLLLPYAGWSAGTTAPGQSGGASSTSSTGGSGAATSSKSPGGTSSSTSSSSSSSSGGSGSFIPANDLSKWGSAGTPDLSVVVLAQDQTAALALERGGLPQGMLLALPQSLLSSDTTGKAILATSAAPKTNPHSVVWLGSASSPALRDLLAQGVHVLIAPQLPPQKVAAAASGGATFVVLVRGADLPALSTLAQQISKAGYELVRPTGF